MLLAGGVPAVAPRLQNIKLRGRRMYRPRILCLQRRSFAPLAFWSDPNRDPNAEKSGGIIRAGNDEAAKFSEQKGAKMP